MKWYHWLLIVLVIFILSLVFVKKEYYLNYHYFNGTSGYKKVKTNLYYYLEYKAGGDVKELNEM